MTPSCGTGGIQVGGDTFNAHDRCRQLRLHASPTGPASSTVSVTVSDSDGASDTDSIDRDRRQRQAEHRPDRCGHRGRGRDPHLQLHRHRSRPGHAHDHDRLRRQRRQGRGSDTYNAGTGVGSFQCFFADGPATTNVTATVTDSDGASDTDNQVVTVRRQQRRPDGDPVGANDLSVNEGTSHTYSFTTSDPGEDDFALLSTDCGANGTQVGLATFNTDHRCRQLRLLLPRRPGELDRLGPGRGLRRRRQQHRDPDGRRRQRRARRSP